MCRAGARQGFGARVLVVASRAAGPERHAGALHLRGGRDVRIHTDRSERAVAVSVTGRPRAAEPRRARPALAAGAKVAVAARALCVVTASGAGGQQPHRLARGREVVPEARRRTRRSGSPGRKPRARLASSPCHWPRGPRARSLTRATRTSRPCRSRPGSGRACRPRSSRKEHCPRRSPPGWRSRRKPPLLLEHARSAPPPTSPTPRSDERVDMDWEFTPLKRSSRPT
jgi:hypothetical protein